MERIFEITGQRGIIDTGIPLNATVKEAISARRRRRHRADNLLAIEDVLLQQESKLVQGERDKLLWKQKEDVYKESFSTKATWDLLRVKKQKVYWKEAVWFQHSTPKFSFCAWLATLNRLSTGDRIVKWDPGSNPVCVLCSEEDETRDHLFFKCKFTKEIWRNIIGNLLRNRYTEDWSRLLSELVDRTRRTKTEGFLARYAFQVAVWSVWRERNERKHGGDPKQVQ